MLRLVLRSTLYAINPATIIVLVPIASAVFATTDPFDCIVYGSFVAAGSALWLALGSTVPLAVLFVLTLSVGEAVYSPKVYEYSMLVAPRGQEALFTNLASVPMFVAKLFAGSVSGVLLNNFCPDEPPRRCDVMWLIIGAMSLSSPILMLLVRRVIHTDEVRRRLKDHGALEQDGEELAVANSNADDGQDAAALDDDGNDEERDDDVEGDMRGTSRLLA